jgi:AraC-like DNA-binding protein/quercetin dioxygenase-like cupin family protein
VTDLNFETAGEATAQRRGPARSVAASGRIYFWQSGSLWIGKGQGRSEWHDHHAHQLALALDGEFRFRTERNGSWTDFEAAIVPSHCPHEFELDGATMAHLFVEPESAEGRALSKQFDGSGISALPQPAARRSIELLLDAIRGHADADAARAVARTAVATLAGTTAVAPVREVLDPRLIRALAHIRSRVRAPVSLADAAAAATLSPSRFRHLFVQATGTSFRAYLLWLRINVAIEAAMAGASWTEAAHEAGFADSSHLSRTHRRMFGIEPTAIRHE